MAGAKIHQKINRIQGAKLGEFIIDDLEHGSYKYGRAYRTMFLPDERKHWARAMPGHRADIYISASDEVRNRMEANILRVASIPGARYLEAKRAKRIVARRVQNVIEAAEEPKWSHSGPTTGRMSMNGPSLQQILRKDGP